MEMSMLFTLWAARGCDEGGGGGEWWTGGSSVQVSGKAGILMLG